jgi:hypothetical protein
MGDRAAIQFVNGDEQSVVLCSHWGGMEFVRGAQRYVWDLKKEIKNDTSRMNGPLERFEPNTVMVDFIRHITSRMKRVTNDLYLGATEDNVDCSDNGLHRIDLNSVFEVEK